MAFSSFLKTINAPASTGNQSYTGVGFQPKVILFFGAGLGGSDTISGVHAVHDFGVGISSSSQRAVSFFSSDGDKDHPKGKYHSDASCFIQSTFAAGLLVDVALVTMDADGFTLNFVATSSGARIHCLCLGGDHLTNVALETILTPGSTGNQSYTGAGFQPDFIMGFGIGHTSAPPSGSTANSVVTIGCASALNATQHGVGYFANDAGSSTDASKIQDSKLILIPNANGSGMHTEAVVNSYDSTGCTLNWQTLTAANMRFFLLYIKGGKHIVGYTTQKTSTGTQSTGNIGIVPNGVFNFSSQQTALSTVGTSSHLSVGAATSTSNRAAIWCGETDTGSDSVADRYSDTGKMIDFLSEGTPTLLAAADLSSLAGPTGITYNWTTADANARYIGYWAFSESLYEEASGGAVVGGSAVVTPTQAQGCKSAGTGASDNSNAGNVAWTTPENIVSSNDSYATISTSDGEVTEYIKATNFGFNLNPDAEIVGISVNVEKRCGSNGASNNYTDAAAYIVKGGTIQTAENKALAGRWATTDTVYAYGGDNDLWGVTWTASDINASNFGFVLSAEDTGGQTSRVDHIEICVSFMPVTVTETPSGGGTAGGTCSVNVIHNINPNLPVLPGFEGGAIGCDPIGEPICGSPVDPASPAAQYGVLCNGEAFLPEGTTYNEVGSGGATAGGVARINVIYNVTAAGGATGGGTSTVSLRTSITATGGAIASGESLESEVFTNNGSGGATCGGTATVRATYNVTATGGATAGGAAAIPAIYNITAAGGAVGGGTAKISLVTFNVGSGGATAGGTSSVNKIFPVTATGGATCAGTSAVGFLYTSTAGGGATAGGTASIRVNYNISATGGATEGGTSTISGVTNLRGSGGAIGGGTGFVRLLFTKTASGGATCSGRGLISHDLTASGGAVGGSTSTVRATYNITASGGAKASGTSTVTKFAVNTIVGSGGAIASGKAAFTDFIRATGGAVAGGRAIISITVPVSGGAVAGGTARIAGTAFNETGAGGAVSGGTSKVSLLGLHGINISGGATANGTAIHTLRMRQVATGGGLAGGSIFLQDVIAGRGGVTISGVALAPAKYTISTTGGGVLGGTGGDNQCIANTATSDVKSPGSAANNSSLSGTTPNYVFNSPSEAISSNNAYASAIMTINPSTAGWLVVNNFGLRIPTGATINGITFTIERSASQNSRIRDSSVRILKSGAVVGTDKANTTLAWTTSDSVRTYGGASDLWGTTWTKAELESSTFGLAIKVAKTGTGSNIAARIDHVQCTVNFVGGFTVCVTNVIASGGARAGGQTEDGYFGTGGIRCGGAVEGTGGTGVIISALHPIGGIAGAGSATVRTIFNTPSYNGGLWGGVRANGETFVENFPYIIGSGGAVLGGKATTITAAVASGGATGGGTTLLALGKITRGGATASGAGIDRVTYNVTTSTPRGVVFGSEVFTSVTPGPPNDVFDERGEGGAKAGGASTNFKSSLMQNAAGATVGGTNVPLQIYAPVPTGGAKLSGTSTSTFTGNSVATGGARCGGISPIYENVIARGGAKASGTAIAVINYVNLDQFKIAVAAGGTATVKETITLRGSGGAIANGTALFYKLYRDTAAGGGVVGGKARQTYDQIASGGATLGGIGEDLNQHIINATGGCVTSPQSSATSIWHISGIDGAKLGGKAKIIFIRDVHTVLTKRIGILLGSENVLNVEEIIHKLRQIDDGPVPEDDEDAPRANEMSEWCQVKTRCKEGVVTNTALERQEPYVPDKKIEL